MQETRELKTVPLLLLTTVIYLTNGHKILLDFICLCADGVQGLIPMCWISDQDQRYSSSKEERLLVLSPETLLC